MTHPRITLIARCALTVIMTAGLVPLQIATAQTLTETISPAMSAASVTISPGLGGDDTARIQHAIDNSTGAVRFEAGVYKLNGPLHLRGNRTYIGEGSWDPRYGSVLLQQKFGAAIFSVEGFTNSVTIIGLSFDGAPGTNAKGIAAGNSTAVLSTSVLRDNYFLAGLAEGIDTSMVATRIERNQFGLNGPFGLATTRRHIHSVYPGGQLQTNANFIVGNGFGYAKGSESLLFEAGVKLHILDNTFQNNDVDTTLRINGMFQVIIEGNYFEANTGAAQMTFANGLTPDGPIGNYVVRLENNYYNMQGNKYVFAASGATQVFMGYETGSFFSPTAELTSVDIFQACYLRITSPVQAFRLNGYMGKEIVGNPACR